MSKKNTKSVAVTPETPVFAGGPSVSDVISSVTAPVESVEVIAATPEAPETPAPEKKTPAPFRVLGARDAYGFGSDTEVSFLVRALEAGNRTKAEILRDYLAAFVPNGNESDIKRKKISFSVFFSDSRRPIGTYHASRSLVILVDSEGRYSLDPERAETVKAAIKNGILSDLRGVKPGGRRAYEILAKYGLPGEEKKSAE